MGSRYRIRDFLKSFVNFPAWMGASHLKRTAVDIGKMSKELFTVQPVSVREETFEEAVQRFRLTDADLAQRQRVFARLTALYLAIFFCLGIYAFYLWYRHDFLSVLMTFVLMMVTASFAFKEHFWYVQMRQKRLGLTPKEWFLFTVGKRKARTD